MSLAFPACIYPTSIVNLIGLRQQAFNSQHNLYTAGHKAGEIYL
ncbi:hypothetical protein [Nostoc sp.]